MNKPLITKDVAAKTITVERSFAASRSRVWQAWTTSEQLDKWWAPKPWKAVTKSFDFREGGHWLYNMLGPDGTGQYCWFGYETIKPEEQFTGHDMFCDENGKQDESMPSMHWNNDFRDEGETTKVVVTIQFESEADLQKIIGMGFEAGFSMGLSNLDEVLAA